MGWDKAAGESLAAQARDLERRALRERSSAASLVNDYEGADGAVAEAEEYDRLADKLAREAADIRAALAEIERLKGWRCFHCGVLFTRSQEAIEHFGTQENKQPTKCLSEVKRLKQRIATLEAALREIAAIPNRYLGGDWDEIEQARKIAGAALAAQPANPQEGRTERLVRQAIQHLHDGYIGAAIACLRGVLGEDALTPVAAQPAQEGR